MEIDEQQTDVQVAEYKKILDEFKKIPSKPIYEPTYLELCEYPWNRREEICSRLFAFFFDTRNPHGFGTLFIDSLIEIYRSKYNSNAVFGKSNVLIAETEVKTSNDNRIDLVITSDDFIICIENKIWAQRYNPFDDYFNYIESIKGDRKTFFIILSMSGGEYPEGSEGQFKVIYYREIIEKIKENIGAYLIDCNRTYLPVLTDWFKYLENKGGLMSNLSDKERAFFLDEENNKNIEKLIERRNQFLSELNRDFKRRVDNIGFSLNKMNHDCLSGNWYVGDLYLKGCFKERDKDLEIGIEASFSDLMKEEFKISISIWKSNGYEKRIALYDAELKRVFANMSEPCETSGKWYVGLGCLKNFDDEKIVKELYDVYKKMENIVIEMQKKMLNSK